MKAFLAYRFTGEDQVALVPMVTAVRDTFAEINVDSYATLFDQAEFTKKATSAGAIMEHAFGVIDASSFLFVILTSDNKSEGVLIEIGYCIAKGIPVIVAVKDTVTSSYAPQLATTSFVWRDVDELRSKIRALKLGAL